MNAKFSVFTPKGEYNVFTGQGFFNPHSVTYTLHRHYNTEIHIVSGDDSVFGVDGKEVIVPADSVLVIPPECLHNCTKRGANAIHCAFQTDYEVNNYGVFSIDSSFAQMFFDNLEAAKTYEDYAVVSSWIALLISLNDKNNKLPAHPIDDVAFIIERFFAVKYTEDVTLNDLAKVLNLSARQTERLVIMHTGLPFRKKLCQVRMEMASELMKNSDLSLNEISTKVGYKSYAGFWKAMKNRQ